MPAAVAGDYFVLGQPITPEAVQGMGLVMAGAMIVIHAGRRRNGDDE
jgi:drug/metabolite transporter (DMT)-like permease